MNIALQSVLEVAGVSAAMVFDSTGRLLCHRGSAIFDRGRCEHLGGIVALAIDAVRLQQEDWDSISAQYAGGKLLLRKLVAGSGAIHTLAVATNTNLNASFAMAAIQVALNELKKALDEGAASQQGSNRLASTSSPAAPLPADAISSPNDSRSIPSGSGAGWFSKSSSSIGLSGIAVAAPSSGAFLARAAKELARHVGPKAKLYVEEAVRRVSPDAPFSLAVAHRLIDDLAGRIADADDRAQFCKAVAKPSETELGRDP